MCKREVEEDAIYVYCFARPLEHVGGDNVICYRFNNIVAVGTTVAVEDYCGPAAEERMRDVSWIGPRACQHEQAIERVMERSAVLPVHFGTLFSSEAALREFLRSHYFEISNFLDRVSGTEEWSVRVLFDGKTARKPFAHGANVSSAGSSASLSGAEYLQLRARQASTEAELTNWLTEAAQELRSRLAAFTVDFHVRPLLHGDDPGSGKRLLYNWVFLVSKSTLKEFHECIHEINAEVRMPYGLALEAVGPWPPYSFVAKWDVVLAE